MENFQKSTINLQIVKMADIPSINLCKLFKRCTRRHCFQNMAIQRHEKNYLQHGQSIGTVTMHKLLKHGVKTTKNGLEKYMATTGIQKTSLTKTLRVKEKT